MSNQGRSHITVEVSSQQMDTLQKASELAGLTVGQFIAQSSLAFATLQLTDGDYLRQLHVDDGEVLAGLLENPPDPNEALLQAFARLSQEYGSVPDHPAKPAT